MLKHFVILTAALLHAPIAGVHAAEAPEPAPAAKVADVDALEAIRRCRDFIRSAQLDDGAFRVSTKTSSARVWPY